MVVVLTEAVRAFGLTFKVFTQNHVGFQRLKRVNDDGQFFVFDFNRLNAVSRCIAVIGDDVGDFLSLEQHFAVRQNHLFVARKGRHPVQTKGFKVFGCQNRNNAGNGHGRFGVDRGHTGVRIGRTYEVAEQHAVEFDIIDVAALALGKAHVLDAFARRAHALKVGGALVLCQFVLHSAASFWAFIMSADARIALTMF